MGKKKTPKKTKELSVAIAESSSTGGEPAQQQQQQQQQTPRKRGRPRKVIDKIESGEIKEEQSQDLSEAQVVESESKRPKMSKEEEEEEEEKKEEPQMKEVRTQSYVVGDAKEAPQRSRRARRKSKPHKSSQN